MAEFQMLEIKEITPAKINYRRTCTEKGMKELTASIKTKGVLQPVLVRPLKAGKNGGKFEMVAGSRRYKAAKDAALRQIPAMVRDLTDMEVLEIQVIENDHREDPNPIDQAFGYKALLDKGTWTPEMLALKMDKSVRFVTERIRLTQLSEKAQAALTAGKILLGHALLMTRLKNAADQAEALKRIEGSGLSVKTLEQQMGYWFSNDLSTADFDIADAGCDECEFNSKNQNVLFPELSKEPSACMDKSCFTLKTRQHYENVIMDKDGNGFKVITKKDQVLKLIPEYTSYTKTAILIGPKDGYTPRGQTVRPARYKSDCAKCTEHHAYFLYEDAKNHSGPLFFGEICTKKSCLDKMNKKEAPKPGNQQEDGDDDDNEPSPWAKRSRAVDCIKRFYLQTIAQALNAESENAGTLLAAMTIRDRYIILILLSQVTDMGMLEEEAMDELYSQLDPEFQAGGNHFDLKYAIAAKIPTENMGQAKRKIIEAMLKEEGDADLLAVLGKDTGVVVADEIVVDKQYLDGMTMKELLAYAAECGLKVSKKIDKPAIVKMILEEDTLPCPAEITAVLKGEEIKETEEEDEAAA